jgi:F-type H+-transporting ATPase subunit delta
MAAIAGRYARALAEVVVDVKMDPKEAIAELGQLTALVHDNTELRNILQNPAVPQKQKLALLDAIVARSKVSKMLRNFVAVLIDQRRIGNMEEIAEQFKHELNDRLGIAEAEISSVRELSAAEKKALEAQVSAASGKKVTASYTQDAGLLGGAVVRVGSTIYDGSVLGQLRKMKRQITGS